MGDKLYLGVDIGSTFCKAALIVGESGELVGYNTRESGTDFALTAKIAVEASLRMAGAQSSDVAYCVSTGYGRHNLDFSDRVISEISCHAKAASTKYHTAMTMIDIGGQDNKVVAINDKGERTSFKMNRKCAAGTGAFIEEMAGRLKVHLSDMDGLARQATHDIKLGSFCTVYAGTEVLGLIRQGVAVPDIVKGVFYSVIKRVTAMQRISGKVLMTGGVAEHNPYILTLMEELTDCEVLLAQHPQLFGAIGAAIYASESSA